MTAQQGRDLLLKLDTNNSGSFETLAGLRSTRISFNAATVDITNIESAGQWRELLAGAGVKTASLSGSGVFKDAASDTIIKNHFFDGTIGNWQVLIPSFGMVTGTFQITSLEYAGEHDGEATYELSLVSAGALTFAAL